MNCLHPVIRVELTPNGPHFGKQICSDCGKFLGWEKKPETQDRERKLSEFFQGARSARLTQWERTFVDKLEGVKPSPKQLEIVSQIAIRHGLPDPKSNA